MHLQKVKERQLSPFDVEPSPRHAGCSPNASCFMLVVCTPTSNNEQELIVWLTPFCFHWSSRTADPSALLHSHPSASVQRGRTFLHALYVLQTPQRGRAVSQRVSGVSCVSVVGSLRVAMRYRSHKFVLDRGLGGSNISDLARFCVHVAWVGKVRRYKVGSCALRDWAPQRLLSCRLLSLACHNVSSSAAVALSSYASSNLPWSQIQILQQVLRLKLKLKTANLKP